MNSKRLSRTIKIFVILAIFLVSGCAETSTQYRTVYVPKCYEKSSYFSLEFTYPCEEREKAQIASAVCDIMGASAYALIDTNRRIGPTTAQKLFVTSGVENMSTIEAVYTSLGEETGEAYLRDIWNMSVYISQRNITDLTVYPKERFKSCLGTFNYTAAR